MRIILTLTTLVALLLAGCSNTRENQRGRIEVDLRSSLSVGDPVEKIERVLSEKHILFTFDEHQSRYQGRLDPKHWPGGDAVAIWVYIDQKKLLTKVETEVVLTGI